MKNKIKNVLGLFVLAFVCIPIAHAATPTQVSNEAELTAALANGGAIELTANITVDNPLGVSTDTIIDGKGFTITSNIAAGSGNRTIISAVSGELTLTNITLQDSPKYGVQAYNGGKVVLDGVTIKNCAYGAVLINGGTATIKDLTMDSNKAGIEFGQGLNVTGEPALVMNGKMDVTKQSDAIYIDNAQVTKFVVKNEATTEQTVTLENTNVVIKNADGTKVASSNAITEGSTVVVDGTEKVSAPEKTETPSTEQPKEENKVKNPETVDNIIIYITLAIAGLGAASYGVRKLAKQA